MHADLVLSVCLLLVGQAYASGCDIVILGSDFERIQIIPGAKHGNIQVGCVDCSLQGGQVRHTHTYTRTLALSHTHAHTHTHALSHAHTHTHTHKNYMLFYLESIRIL